jgi:deoxyribodipyrimidine photolyase-related protein
MFVQNPGYINPKSCWLATNHQQARGALENFLTTYFENFGAFEDAMTTTDPFVFHSVLSPLINHGLLNPDYILETITTFIYQKYNFDISIPEDSFNQIPENLPLNSLEGFLRQIIGWREWVKGLYDTQYLQEVRERNFFKSTKPLPNYFWELDYNHPELEKNLPLKFALEKLNNWSWNHHIERLMVIANWMTLNEYNPQECLKWFNAMYVDGFDWVMVPNVLGMGMFADGGVFATKPYVAGGNYIKKMSDYPNPSLWEKMWTDKFWQFLIKHRDYFSTNPRLAMLLKNKTSKDISESVN